jgi:ATP-dependent Lon protease
MDNFNLKKFLSENKLSENQKMINEESIQTIKDYYSSRSKGVRNASGVIDDLLNEAGINDPELYSRFLDAISDLVDEIESDID